MTRGPILTPNLGIDYGDWTGGGYSADVQSPSFVPLTQAQKNIPGYDLFDAVSRLHDIDYDTAQQNLLADLSNVNVSGHQAMINYLSALETADQNFVLRQVGATASNAWGTEVQALGTVALGFKGAVEAADVQRLQTDASYAAGWDLLAQEYRREGTAVTLSNDISNFIATSPASGPTDDQVAAFKAELNAMPFISEASDIIALAADAIVKTPTLLPEFLQSGIAIAGHPTVGQLASCIRSAAAVYGPGLSNVEGLLAQLVTTFASSGNVLSETINANSVVLSGTESSGDLYSLAVSADGSSATAITVPFQYNALDYNTGNPVTYSASVSFDNTDFVLPSVRAGTTSNSAFGTTAHFIAGYLDPYTTNRIDLYFALAAGSGNLFVSSTQTSEAITFNTSTFNVGNTPGNFSDVVSSIGIQYDGSVSNSVDFSLSGKVYAWAAAQVGYASGPGPQTYYFHVGDTASIGMNVTNTAYGALADTLRVNVASGSSAGIVTGVSAGDIVQDQTATLAVGLDTSASGVFTVSPGNFSFISHDPDLADATASSGGYSATVNVNNYADPILSNVSSAQYTGTLTQSGNNWTLNFGNIQYNNSSPTATQAVIRISDGTSGGAMDSLKGSLSVSGSGFTDSYSFDISSDVATPGGYFTLGQFSPVVTSLGVHTETIVFHPTGFNASGYSGALADQTLTIIDNVVGPPTLAITSAALQSNQTTVTLGGTVDTADAGLTISIDDGSTVLGTATPNASGAWSSTVTVSAHGVHTLTAQAMNAAGTGVSNSAVDLVGASTSLSGGGQLVLFSGSGDAVTLSATANNWDFVRGPGGTINLNGAQTSVAGGGDTINFLGSSGNAASLYNTAGNWDYINGSGGTVYLTNAQTSVAGGGDTINFLGSSGNAASLYNTAGNWDYINGSGGTVYLTNAQTSVAGGGDTVNLLGSSGNAASLYNTAGNWDYINGSGGTVYLTNAQTSVAGGGDTVNLLGSSGNAASLYNTAGNWDYINGSGGTVYLTNAQTSVAGGGDTIDFLGSSGNAASLYNTAGNWDYINGSGGTVYLTNAQTSVAGGGDTIDFLGSSGNAASLYNTAGNWDYINGSGGTVYLTNAQTSVAGGGDTVNFLGSSGNAASLYNTAGTADTINGSNGSIYLTGAQASVTGNSNTLNFLGTGNTASVSSSSDAFVFQAAFGQDAINGFASSDTMQLAASDFANWSALLGHMTQSGSNTLITLDASDKITLTNVAMSSLQASQFHFV